MSLSPEAIRFALLTRFLKGQAKVPKMPEAAMRIRQLLDDPTHLAGTTGAGDQQ